MVAQKAKVKSISNKFDIAILEISTPIKLPVISIASTAPELAQDVIALGYPSASSNDYSLTVSRGSIMRVTSTDVVHEAKLNAGSSGGPLVDTSGVCIGLNYATRNPGRTIADRLAFAQLESIAVSPVKLLAFIRTVEPNFEEASFLDPEFKDVPSMIKAIRPSVAFIRVFDSTSLQARQPLVTSPSPKSIPVKPLRPTFAAYEDKSCLACAGKQFLDCPNRHCVNGVHVAYDKVSRTTVIGRRVITTWDKKKVTKRCPTCSGRESIPCPFSTNGIDNRFFPKS